MHLQVHCPEKVIEEPSQLYGGRVRLVHAVNVYEDALFARFSHYRVNSKDGCRQGALQCRGRSGIFWEIYVEHVEILFLEHIVRVAVIA